MMGAKKQGRKKRRVHRAYKKSMLAFAAIQKAAALTASAVEISTLFASGRKCFMCVHDYVRKQDGEVVSRNIDPEAQEKILKLKEQLKLKG